MEMKKQILDGLVFQSRVSIERFVQSLYIRGVVLPVVNLHGPAIDVRFKRSILVVQSRKTIMHGRTPCPYGMESNPGATQSSAAPSSVNPGCRDILEEPRHFATRYLLTVTSCRVG
jgi:hypothetical protein